jgi:hypothetical protein
VHFGFHETAVMVSTPSLPDLPAQPARRVQDLIPRIDTTAVRFPGFGVLAGRNDDKCGAPSDRLVAALCIVGAIATDAIDAGNVLFGFASCKALIYATKPVHTKGGLHVRRRLVFAHRFDRLLAHHLKRVVIQFPLDGSSFAFQTSMILRTNIAF